MKDLSTYRRWRSRAGAVVPYLVAALCVYLVLKRHSPGAIYAEIATASAWKVLAMPVALLSVSLLLMAGSDLLLLRHFFPQSRYLDVLRGRAACVSLEVVNYGLGKGSYGLWLAKRYGAPAWLAGGLALYVVSGELCSMCIIGVGAIELGEVQLPPLISQLAAGIAAILVLFILLGPLRLFGDPHLLRPWSEVPRWRGLAHIALRVVQHGYGVILTALAARIFGLDIPLWVLLAHIPVIAVLSALPLNVFGVGLAQGAWLMLEPWAPGEQLVAFSLIWTAAMGAAVVLRGLPFMGRVSREIGLHRPSVKGATARPDDPPQAGGSARTP